MFRPFVVNRWPGRVAGLAPAIPFASTAFNRRLVLRGVLGAAAIALSLLLLPSLGLAEAPEPAAARAQYDLDHGLALQGYDAVAYFTEAKAVKGDASLHVDFEGATYWFSSPANRNAFRADPDRYRPAYGGWCAWAMVDGEKTRPDPTNFIVSNGRLFLFYKNFFVDTKSKWQRGDPAALERKADAHWADLVGS
jgi:YHS domain-containing protein